ncbi:hypothetical protein Tco_0163635 [Tanacetum coccineum]
MSEIFYTRPKGFGKYGKTVADIGYHWRTHRKETSLGKLDCGSQMETHRNAIALGGNVPLTKRSMNVMLWYLGLGCSKAYDGESFKAHEFCGRKLSGSRVTTVEGLGQNLFSVRALCELIL